jgi:hypothetical protein
MGHLVENSTKGVKDGFDCHFNGIFGCQGFIYPGITPFIQICWLGLEFCSVKFFGFATGSEVLTRLLVRGQVERLVDEQSF